LPLTGAEVVRNLMTFDVEDWHQSTVDFDLPITRRVVDNTIRVLEMLESRRILGTFFVLGLVAEAEPGLVRRIQEGGHEVATHGHSHRPVFAMRPDEFRADLLRSMASIQDATGERIVGYRAPDFSITRDALWALEVLSEEGLQYDSSIFPFAGPRYGISEAFTEPCRVLCASGATLVEFPLATISRLGLRLPACGGGYFRLLPYSHSRAAARRFNARGLPATAYFHPYELDDQEIPSSPHRLPLRLRLSQGLGRSRVARRLGRFLDDFRWEPMRAALAGSEALTGGRVLDLREPGRSGSPWRDRTVA
jgi:polysaccharide deacetylase family protein (PEP-CTERM system associated)